jgi:hypothetical protein
MSQDSANIRLLLGSSQPSDTPWDEDYYPGSQIPTSPVLSTVPSNEPPYTPVELFRYKVVGDWRRIDEVYLSRASPVVRRGWCRLVDKATNKGESDVPLHLRKGYVQLSYEGLNKVRAVLLRTLSLC